MTRPAWSTAAWWADTIERAVATAAQTALGVVGADGAGLLEAGWPATLTAAALAALAAILKAVALTAPKGTRDAPQ
jgi:hypothetical protein